MNHFLTIAAQSDEWLQAVVALGRAIKATPQAYANKLTGKTLLMIFEKPSLRTHVSFEAGMTQMGGHAIYYNTQHAPLGSGKETISDTARTASRYVDVISARLYEHTHLEELAQHSCVPVINALTNFSHPCQIMGDLMTIAEHKGRLAGLKLAYCGDGHNNVTHSLLFGCARFGISINVACPAGAEYEPLPTVLEQARQFASKHGSTVAVYHDAREAVAGADVVYTDSWMSYHIDKADEARRVEIFQPYQVNSTLMEQAQKDAIFMNCLPTQRGYEQTAEVIDGPQSVVFDQAENRLYIQKAIILKLLEMV